MKKKLDVLILYKIELENLNSYYQKDKETKKQTDGDCYNIELLCKKMQHILQEKKNPFLLYLTVSYRK